MPAEQKQARYHHGDLRAALVETALGTLMVDGGPELSLRDLARRVGVSPAAPYRHFANVTALLRAVAAEGFARLGEAVERTSGIPAPAERFTAMALAYVTFAEDNRSLYRVMFGHEMDRRADPELGRAMDAAFAPLAAAVSDLETSDPVFGALGAWALLHGLAELIIDGQVAGLNATGRQAMVTNAAQTFATGLRISG